MVKQTLQVDAGNFKVPEPSKADLKQLKKKSPNAIRVLAYEGDTGIPRLITDFEAYRWLNDADKTTYIKNDTYNFLIPMPETKRETKNLDMETLTNRLIDLNEEIKAELTKDTPEINDKDLIDEKLRLMNELRVLLYNSNMGYWTTDGKNPILIVLRKGNTWHPMKWDVDTTTVYTPSNTRLADTRNSETNKRIKYGSLTSLTTISLIFIIITFVAFGTGVYTWYKAFDNLENTGNIQAMGELINTCTIGIKENQDEVKQGVIDGVTDAIMTNQVNNRPVGTGG